METSSRLRDISNRKRCLEKAILISEILVVFFGIIVAVGVVGEWRSTTPIAEKVFSVPVAVGVIGEVLFGVVTFAASEMAKSCQTAIDNDKDGQISTLEGRLTQQESRSDTLKADYEQRIEQSQKNPLLPSKHEDFEVQVYHLETGNLLLEIHPKFGAISACAIAVDMADKDSGNLVGVKFGVSHSPGVGGLIICVNEGNATTSDGQKVWAKTYDNQIDSKHSVYLEFNSTPKPVWFGDPSKMNSIELSHRDESPEALPHRA